MELTRLAHIAGQLEIEAAYLDSLCMTTDGAHLRTLAKQLHAMERTQYEVLPVELADEIRNYLRDYNAVEEFDIDDLHNYLDDAVTLLSKTI